jgi:hypothetical protein
MLPLESERKPSLQLGDFVNNVVLRAECRTGKDCPSYETGLDPVDQTLVVGSYT